MRRGHGARPGVRTGPGRAGQGHGAAAEDGERGGRFGGERGHGELLGMAP